MLDLPAAGSDLDHSDEVGIAQAQRGGPGVAVEHLTLGVGGGQLAPADRKRIVAVAQREIVERAVGVGEALAAVPARPVPCRDFTGALEIRHPLVEYLMAAWQTDELQRAILSQHLFRKRLMAVEIVAEHDAPPRGETGAPLGSHRVPALSSQCCLSAPSRGPMSSGDNGNTSHCPGATITGVNAT